MNPDRSSDGVDTFTIIAYPAAGKGTAVEYMQALFQEAGRTTDLLEMGGRVRSIIKGSDPRGPRFKDFGERGLLIPDDDIIPVMQEGIDGLNPNAVWFIDGAPRNAEGQLKAFLERMESCRRKVRALHLSLGGKQASREIAEARMIQRGQEAQAAGKKPRKEDVDPAARAQRLDEAAVLHDVLRNFPAGQVVTIDSTGSIENTRRQLITAITDLGLRL